MTAEQYKESMILYYADYLALKARNTPVTDSCKYFFIYGIPVYISYIVKQPPVYDINDPYFIQAYNEYNKLVEEFGETGFIEFVNDLCNLRAAGTVDAEMMLRVIFYYNSKYEKQHAKNVYYKWKNKQKYQITTITDDGEQR